MVDYYLLVSWSLVSWSLVSHVANIVVASAVVLERQMFSFFSFPSLARSCPFFPSQTVVGFFFLSFSLCVVAGTLSATHDGPLLGRRVHGGDGCLVSDDRNGFCLYRPHVGIFFRSCPQYVRKCSLRDRAHALATNVNALLQGTYWH